MAPLSFLRRLADGREGEGESEGEEGSTFTFTFTLTFTSVAHHWHPSRRRVTNDRARRHAGGKERDRPPSNLQPLQRRLLSREAALEPPEVV
jgi:hypothetical protein